MILFRDFVPAKTEAGGFFKRDKYEEIVPALQRANDWLDKNPQFEVVNIETVVLPNIYSPKEEGSKDGSLRTHASDGQNNDWYQVIRVWFKEREIENA